MHSINLLSITPTINLPSTWHALNWQLLSPVSPTYSTHTLQSFLSADGKKMQKESGTKRASKTSILNSWIQMIYLIHVVCHQSA